MPNREWARAAFYDALLQDDPTTLYERAPCGYLSTSPDGTIIKVNETFLTWTGFTADDLVHRSTFSALLTKGGQIYHDTHFAPMLQLHGEVREIALEIVKADGTRMPILINALLDRDAEGRPSIVRTAIFDASERRGYERELIEAKRRAEESEAKAVALAKTLQRTLIPPRLPDVPGLDVAGVYRAAGDGEEVGGDFFDVFQLGEGDWVVVIGDVRGKGVEAAVVTALVRYTLRALAVMIADPAEVLHELNTVLLAHETDRFSTVAYIRLRRRDEGWDASIALGGHPPALLRDADGSLTSFGAAGTIVGVFDEPSFHDRRATLRPGQALVLYTDGVSEGRRGAEFYGDERLRAVVRRHHGAAQSLADRIASDAVDFQRGRTSDDIAVVVVAVPGSELP